jgi:hypothetical protein
MFVQFAQVEKLIYTSKKMIGRSVSVQVEGVKLRHLFGLLSSLTAFAQRSSYEL